MGLIIGEKNPTLVQSEDIGNLARMNYGKPVMETAIGEQKDAEKQEFKDADEKSAAERIAKLEEIEKLPEEEQVAALLELGFEKEAAELSAKLAEKQSHSGNSEDEVDIKDEAQKPMKENKEQSAPKKAGRSKKS